MSLASTLASVWFAALPQALRHPCPRRSEAVREFDRLLEELQRAEWPVADRGGADTSTGVTQVPFDGPLHAVRRRARH